MALLAHHPRVPEPATCSWLASKHGRVHVGVSSGPAFCLTRPAKARSDQPGLDQDSTRRVHRLWLSERAPDHPTDLACIEVIRTPAEGVGRDSRRLGLRID